MQKSTALCRGIGTMPGSLPKSLDSSQFCNPAAPPCRPGGEPCASIGMHQNGAKAFGVRCLPISQMRRIFRLSGRSLHSPLCKILTLRDRLRCLPYGMDIATFPSRRPPAPCPPYLVLFSASHTLKQQGVAPTTFASTFLCPSLNCATSLRSRVRQEKSQGDSHGSIRSRRS